MKIEVINKIVDCKKNKLKELDLSEFRLRDIPVEIFDLMHLEYLKIDGSSSFEDLESNEDSMELLTELSPKIGNLINLKELDLGWNQLNKLPEEIGNLTQLESLDLAINSLSELPYTFGKLKNLKRINLTYNHFKEFPFQLCECENLEEIVFARNGYSTIPPEIGRLINLRVLGINDTLVTRLPKEICRLKKNIDIRLFGNKLVEPPLEIAFQGLEAIKIWFDSTKYKENVVELNEVKLIFIGDGGVGKTTIRENLINPNYGLTYHPSTHGIDVKKWHLPYRLNLENGESKNTTCTFNIWDFGGQGKYRFVQQFFSTRNSIYLYVSDNNELSNYLNDKYSGFKYWLNMAIAFGYNRERDHYSPIVFIKNKIDKSVLEIDDEVTKYFTKVDKFIKVSCKTGEGLRDIVQHLVNILYKTGVHLLPFNKNWLNVKKMLEKVSSEHEVVNYEFYINICTYFGLSQTDADVWLRYLNAIGTLIYFPNISGLEDKIILNPNYLRSAIYEIIDNELTKNKNGRFVQDNFIEIWEGRSFIERKQLLNLMKAIEFCFEVESKNSDENIFIIPILFEQPRPIEIDNKHIFNNENKILYEFEFTNFIPAGILSRLIVRLNHLVYKNNFFWKDGVLFEKNDIFAEVTEDWLSQRIIIKLNDKNSIELLLLIRHELDIICQKLEQSKFLRKLERKEFLTINNQRHDFQKLYDKFNFLDWAVVKDGSSQIGILNVYGETIQIADKIYNQLNKLK